LREHHNVVCAVGAAEDELMNLVADREVLIFRSGVSITAEVMACAPRLQLLIRAGSGLDNVDTGYIRDRGLKLVRIAEPGARAVAELAFGLMLALARQILEADRLLRSGRWAKHQLHGFLLQGKQLGIIGVGNIGTVAGQMGVSWGMQVVGCVEHPSAARSAELGEKQIRLTDLGEVLAVADYACVFVPLKESTRYLIGAAELARMKPGAFLINMARGEVVDEEALCKALQAKDGLAGAALDVHKHEGENLISPLAGLPNVILTPHIGAMTIDTQREIGRRIIEIINDFSNGAVSAAKASLGDFTSQSCRGNAS
jgi:phosphoglycerate dehydrogenase-like enzyme